ncbi:Outer membrane protein assembly factor YaeT precursor [Paramagnetospirillum magnetotacticum MS-1]|uniref:Outer membrane protein assembly factor YaeT n=1 Tax=Paramagnetospirillum magnetotacticum MS-1 TaxID=272627 RepID=A0A0C2V6G4_PARME|nr:OmpA family protein [Paramagnetospirillum magnetotacticum]KIM00637.1 Outer membrane protein assembly factor YaeT precursor [Paramagnetospirillum magnetotacticum MS-1]
MKFLHIAAAIGMTALLGACATPWEVADVNEITAAEAPTAGSAFTKALFAEYKAYAIQEAKVEYEWDDAAIFARKGLRAATGESVAPAEVTDWEVPAARTAELTAARARLVGYFGNGARERVPAAAAKAQVMFDCWVEEEHEGDANSDCRAAFLKIEPELQVKAAAPAPKIVKTFIVYFDFNKSTLTKEAQKTLKEVVASAGQIKPSSIYVAGHTDTVGKAGYNDKLSKARAAAVEKQLAKLGVKSIDAKAFGFAKLAVPTKANTKEAKNRRVEIYFEK